MRGPACFGEDHVSGGVITLDDHQGEGIMEAQVQAIVQCSQHPGAEALVSGGHGNALRGVKLAGIHLAIGIHQQRDFDHAHGVHHFVSVDGDFFAGIQRLHVDAPIGAHALGDALQAMLEQI